MMTMTTTDIVVVVIIVIVVVVVRCIVEKLYHWNHIKICTCTVL